MREHRVAYVTLQKAPYELVWHIYTLAFKYPPFLELYPSAL
jgi:hypothetical protein